MSTGTRLRRAAWSVGAQGLSSASNLMVQYGLLVSLDGDGFGRIVVALSCHQLAVFLGRAWLGDPLVALAPTGEARPWAGTRPWYLALGSGAAVVVAALAAAWGPVRPALIVLAVALPALLVQDGYRYLLWSRRAPVPVVALDGVWVAVSAATVGVALAGWPWPSAGTATVIMAAWAGGGVASSLVGAVLVSRVPAPARSGPVPDGAEASSARTLALSQSILALDGNGLPMAVGAVAGPAVTAGLRAAALPMLPLTSVLGASRILTLPALRRAVVERRVAPTLLRLGAAQAAVAAVVVGVALVAVVSVPPAWLGDSGRLGAGWYAVAGLVVAARMLNLPLADVLSLGAGPERVIAVRLVTTGVDWMAALTGAVLWGVPGALVGRGLAAVAATVIWASTVAVAVTGPTAFDVAPVAAKPTTGPA